MSRSWSAGSDTRWRRFRPTILDRDHWTCRIRLPCCTGKAEHVHHVIPLVRGGSKYDPGNCVAACAACNQALGDNQPVRQPDPRPTTEW